MQEFKKDYNEKYLEIVKGILLKNLKNHSCRAFLFGSQVTSNLKKESDIDIGIENIPKDDFYRIRTKVLLAVEESVVPYHLDIINFDIVDKKFKENVLKNIILWKVN